MHSPCVLHPPKTQYKTNNQIQPASTVRKDTRNSDGTIRTSQQTHASTKNIVGTSPYIAPEVRSSCEKLEARSFVCVYRKL